MIAQELVSKGILQVGLFQDGEGSRPYRLRLEMLPAYPRLLEEISQQMIAHASLGSVDRIVADTNVMPLGILLSIATQIPLVYSRGREELPVHDLVGAYDVGHPAVLLIGEVTAQTEQLISNCGRVGLEIQQVIALIGEPTTINERSAVPILSFSAMITELEEAGLLPQQQAQAMLEFRG